MYQETWYTFHKKLPTCFWVRLFFWWDSLWDLVSLNHNLSLYEKFLSNPEFFRGESTLQVSGHGWEIATKDTTSPHLILNVAHIHRLILGNRFSRITVNYAQISLGNLNLKKWHGGIGERNSYCQSSQSNLYVTSSGSFCVSYIEAKHWQFPGPKIPGPPEKIFLTNLYSMVQVLYTITLQLQAYNLYSRSRLRNHDIPHPAYL